MVNILAYTTTNVTTSAYVTLIASLSVSTNALVVVDTSTQLLKLATGVAGQEVDFCVFQGNGNPVVSTAFIQAGTRISIKAISASATSGFNTVSAS